MTTMIRVLVDFTRRTASRQAGGCPGYGSGSRIASVSAQTRQVSVPRKVLSREVEEDQATFRDVSSMLRFHFLGISRNSLLYIV